MFKFTLSTWKNKSAAVNCGAFSWHLFMFSYLVFFTLFLSACGSHRDFFSEHMAFEAEVLGQHCKRLQLESPLVKRADSLLTQSQKLKKDEPDQASQLADEASVLYQLSLASKNEQKSAKNVEMLEFALKQDQDQLQSYRDVLAEIKSMRKP